VNSVNGEPVETSELQLVEAAARGDREARRELFERYRQAAFRVAWRITGRHEDALDVVQDGFIRAFERLEGFRGEARFKTWLLRIVSSRALDLLRARKVRLAVSLDGGRDDAEPGFAPPAAPDEPPDARCERQALSEKLRHAIEALPPDQRATFSLYAVGELTYGEIAAALGVPIGTVMSRLHHARRRLREMLPDLAPEGAFAKPRGAAGPT